MHGRLNWIGAGVVGWVLGVMLSGVAMAQPGMIDLKGGWEVEPSEGNSGFVEFEERMVDGRPIMRLHYNFATGSGFVIARKVIDRKLPASYSFEYVLSGSPAKQTIEFKMLDASKLNVWWVNRRNVELSAVPDLVRHRKRHFEFAWGPSGAEPGGPKPFAEVHAIEIVVTSATGGKGFIEVQNLELKERPNLPIVGSETKVTALLEGKPRAELLDRDFETGVLLNESGQAWPEGSVGREMLIATEPASEIGDVSLIGPVTWRFEGMRQTSEGLFGVVRVWKDARSKVEEPLIREVVVHAESRSENPTGFVRGYGRTIYDGRLPRAYVRGEQSFWTVMGEADGKRDEALINEDGAIEIFRSGPSVEPFLQDAKGTILTWADGVSEASLLRGFVPVAKVRRNHEGLVLEVEAFVEGAYTWVQYRVINNRQTPETGALVLGLRPYQVNPPWQFLGVPGGVGTHRSIEATSEVSTKWKVNDEMAAWWSRPSELYVGQLPSQDYVVNPVDATALKAGQGAVAGPLGSIASRMPYDLAPGQTMTVTGVLAVAQSSERWRMPVEKGTELDAEFETKRHAAEIAWLERLTRVGVSLPPEGQWMEESVRANLAYILINKDGNGFQPGSRSYERSWIRDGSMTALSLLEFGIGEEVGPFVEWYAGYQFANGMVPCVVDTRGPDPVKEHDSHGQLIWAIWNVYAYTGDQEVLRRQWPVVQKAVEYIQSQRATRMTEEWKSMTQMRQEPGKPAVPMKAFFGLMPESISHEGYSAKPMHSHWDNFFTILGLKRASDIAKVLRFESEAKAYDAAAREMRQNLIDSVRMTQGIFGIDYIPGCVELGDFDATSTTIAVNPCDEGGYLPKAWVEATFERYWQSFMKRAEDEARTWKDYTPYEWRVVGTLVKLGQRERAMKAAEWFARDQYPQGWRHWGEIVWGNPRAGRFIGDMPHTWVGSDFLRSVRTMLVYERSGVDGAADELVIFGGIPESWVQGKKEGRGVRFERFVTEYGVISAMAEPDGDRVKVEVQFAPFTDGRGSKNFGGVVIDLFDRPSQNVKVNGVDRTSTVREDGSVVVKEFPAIVEFLPAVWR